MFGGNCAKEKLKLSILEKNPLCKGFWPLPLLLPIFISFTVFSTQLRTLNHVAHQEFYRPLYVSRKPPLLPIPPLDHGSPPPVWPPPPPAVDTEPLAPFTWNPGEAKPVAMIVT